MKYELFVLYLHYGYPCLDLFTFVNLTNETPIDERRSLLIALFYVTTLISLQKSKIGRPISFKLADTEAFYGDILQQKTTRNVLQNLLFAQRRIGIHG
jgi:hypothetical protein